MNKSGNQDFKTPSPMQNWLSIRACAEKNKYQLQFRDHHLGNPLIRSVHGGVTASLIEMCAEHCLAQELDEHAELHIVSSSVDYLRVTKDVDIYARSQIVRISRRLAFVDVWCWQDAEDIAIARGTCTLRVFQ